MSNTYFLSRWCQAEGAFGDVPEDEVGEEDLPMEDELMASDEEGDGGNQGRALK